MTDTEGSLLPRVIIIVRLTFVLIPQAQLPQGYTMPDDVVHS